MKLISVRKLAIIDSTLHGRKIILAEFFIAAFVGIILGGYVLLHAVGGHALWIGLGLLGIGLNYVPLAFYGLWNKSERVLDEELLSLQSKRAYTVQALFLAIPFLVLIIALFQFGEAVGIKAQ
jgi:hypothetical protein